MPANPKRAGWVSPQARVGTYSCSRPYGAELGAPEPALAPFDANDHDPMPEVEIDPDDEFHAGRKPETSG